MGERDLTFSLGNYDVKPRGACARDLDYEDNSPPAIEEGENIVKKVFIDFKDRKIIVERV